MTVCCVEYLQLSSFRHILLISQCFDYCLNRGSTLRYTHISRLKQACYLSHLVQMDISPVS